MDIVASGLLIFPFGLEPLPNIVKLGVIGASVFSVCSGIEALGYSSAARGMGSKRQLTSAGEEKSTLVHCW